MQIPDGIRPDERILVLGIPVPAVIAVLCRAVSGGSVAVLCDREQIYEARKASRDLHNVMFVPGTPDVLPWSDGYFTRVLIASDDCAAPPEVQAEMERVMSKDRRG